MKALPLALALGRAQQAKLILLHMLPPIPMASASLSAYAPAAVAADEFEEWEGTHRKRALKALKECLPAETGLEHPPEFVVGTDFLAEGIRGGQLRLIGPDWELQSRRFGSLARCPTGRRSRCISSCAWPSPPTSHRRVRCARWFSTT